MSLLFALRGQKGDPGEPGEQGEQGEQGVKGDTGDPGFFTSRCSVYRTSVQLIPHSTGTKVVFNAKLYDNDDEWDTSSNSRFTAKKAGVYHVSAQLMYLSINAATLCQAHIRRNGGRIKECTRTHYAKVNEFVPVSGDVPLEVGQYIEIFAQHDNGNSRDISGTLYRTYCDIHQIA